MREKTRLKVEGLITGRRRDGKNFYDETAKRKLMRLCEEGVASVAAIALANDVNPNVLHRWLTIERRRGHVDAATEERVSHLLPVVIEENMGAPGTEPCETDVQPNPVEEVELEIEFARGTLRFRQPLDQRLLQMITDTLASRC
jgi:transposase-like protein